MKTMLTVSALLMVSVLALRSAKADAIAVSSAAPAPAATSVGYFQLGLVLGADTDTGYDGVELDAGKRISGPVYAHAGAVLGKPEQLFASSVSGDYEQARGGFELRGCSSGGGACVMVGADVGVRHFEYVAVGGLFDSSSVDSGKLTDTIAVPRLQLDFGGDTYRFRTSWEGVYGSSGVNGFQMALGMALQI